MWCVWWHQGQQGKPSLVGVWGPQRLDAMSSLGKSVPMLSSPQSSCCWSGRSLCCSCRRWGGWSGTRLDLLICCKKYRHCCARFAAFTRRGCLGFARQKPAAVDHLQLHVDAERGCPGIYSIRRWVLYRLVQDQIVQGELLLHLLSAGHVVVVSSKRGWRVKEMASSVERSGRQAKWEGLIQFSYCKKSNNFTNALLQGLLSVHVKHEVDTLFFYLLS